MPMKHISETEFIQELQDGLPTSLGEQRKAWAGHIIEHDLDLINISILLHSNARVAMRFAWLLTGIGERAPSKLFNVLPYLLQQSATIQHFKFSESFANYWLIVGIPKEDEAKAIELLFQWLWSNETNVTIKSRAIKVVFRLSSKYPELKNELSLGLRDQMNKHSDDFKKKAMKMLVELNN